MARSGRVRLVRMRFAQCLPTHARRLCIFLRSSAEFAPDFAPEFAPDHRGGDGKDRKDWGPEHDDVDWGQDDKVPDEIVEVYDPTKAQKVSSSVLDRDARADPRMIQYVRKLFETEIVGHPRVKNLVKMLVSEIETDEIRYRCG